MALSTTLYDSLASESINHENQDAFLWIWYWLLVSQPKESLEDELNKIKDEADSRRYSSQTLAELAWKATVVEQLLAR